MNETSMRIMPPGLRVLLKTGTTTGDSLFKLSDEAQAVVWRCVALFRARLAADFRPDGINVGIDGGPPPGLPSEIVP
jgi:diadenosine tetraphosphate (Ap4A) HIT family hydrolase